MFDWHAQAFVSGPKIVFNSINCVPDALCVVVASLTYGFVQSVTVLYDKHVRWLNAPIHV